MSAPRIVGGKFRERGQVTTRRPAGGTFPSQSFEIPDQPTNGEEGEKNFVLHPWRMESS